VKRTTTCLLLAASGFLAGCVSSNWQAIQSMSQTPLSTAEIRERFAGNTLAIATSSGKTEQVYVTSTMEFVPVEGGRSRAFSFDMLGNGLLCSTAADRRFCYRVYEKGGQFAVVYANGEVFQKGQIAKGNKFGV
jgi:hypothetical protein